MSLCRSKLELMEATHSDLVLQCELPLGHSGSHQGLVWWPQHWVNHPNDTIAEEAHPRDPTTGRDVKSSTR